VLVVAIKMNLYRKWKSSQFTLAAAAAAAAAKSNGILLTATHDVYAMRSQLLLGWLKAHVPVWVSGPTRSRTNEECFECLLELFSCGFSLYCYGRVLVISAVRCSSFGFWVFG